MTHRIHLDAPEGADCFRLSKDSVTYYKLGEDDLVYRWTGTSWRVVYGITQNQFTKLPGTHMLDNDLLVWCGIAACAMVVVMLA